MPIRCFSPKSVVMTDAWERFSSRLAKKIFDADVPSEADIRNLIIEMLTQFRGKYE